MGSFRNMPASCEQNTIRESMPGVHTTKRACTMHHESHAETQKKVIACAPMEACQPFSSVADVGKGERKHSGGPPPTKDKICRNFLERNGLCKYGQVCYFAHGDAELGASNAHILG